MAAPPKKLAIITGSSSGLGEEFALALDARREVDELWLVARREGELQRVAARCKHTRTRLFALDLSLEPSRKLLLETFTAETGATISYLINNAGIGHYGLFEKRPEETYRATLSLNIEALVDLTYKLLRGCTPGSNVILVASTVGLIPVPGMAIYAATKAFVVSFGLSLSEELRARNVHVLTLCPGPVQTPFASLAGGSIQEPSRKKIHPAEVVSQTLAACGCRKILVVSPPFYRWMLGILRLFPLRLQLALGRKMMTRRGVVFSYG